MSLYRISLLDRSDWIKVLETFACLDDDEAEDMAAELLRSSRYVAVKIWEETERIYRAEKQPC